jgi:hypothetical protein
MNGRRDPGQGIQILGRYMTYCGETQATAFEELGQR